MDASQVFCLAQRVLLPRRPDSGKIPAKHPSALLLFSYSQTTDRCFFIPSFRTSVHRLMESYRLAPHRLLLIISFMSVHPMISSMPFMPPPEHYYGHTPAVDRSHPRPLSLMVWFT